MATWYSLKKGSTAGNISMDVEYGITSVVRTSTTNVRVTYGIRFKQSSSTYTYNSVAAFIPKGGTRRYAFNSGSGSSHTSSGTWYYAYTDGKTHTSEYAGFTQDITVTVQQTSASFDVGFGWNGYTPAQKGTGTITVTFPVGATVPTGLTCSVTDTQETKVTLSGAYGSDGNATVTATGYQYKTENGSWTAFSNGSTTLTPGTKYYFRYYATNSQGTAYSDGSCNTTTYKYPYVTAFKSNPYKIGSTLTISVYNPLKRPCTAYVKNSSQSGTEFGHVTVSGGSSDYNVSVTNSTLYGCIPNSKTGTMVAYCVCTNPSNTSGNTTATYSIKDDGTEKPTFTTSNIINVVDTLKTSITGDNTKFIKGYNHLTGAITPMSSSYGANLDYYSITANASNITATDMSSGGSIPYKSGTNITFSMDNITTNSFKITGTDKRTLSTEVTKAITLIDYSKPTLTSSSITRQDGVGDHIYLNLSGKYTNWSGLAQTNSIISASYRYKAQGTSTWGSWISITGITNSSGTWGINKLLDSIFNNTTKYDLEVKVTDKLDTSTFTGLIVSTANAIIWRDLQNKRIGIGKKPDYTLDVEGSIHSSSHIYPGGQIRKDGNGSWIGARDYCSINNAKGDTSGSYSAVVGQKTKDGHWTIGRLNENANNLEFVYTTDANYSSGTNTQSGRVKLSPHNGNIMTTGNWLNTVYPVGSIYLSATPTNPGTIFGGTWQQLKNHFLFATNATSGNKGKDAVSTSTGTNVTGTALTTNQIPAHTHGSKSLVAKFNTRAMTSGGNIMDANVSGNSTGSYTEDGGASWSAALNYTSGKNLKCDVITINDTHEHTSVGGGATHNHEVPYIEVYVWQRTA